MPIFPESTSFIPDISNTLANHIKAEKAVKAVFRMGLQNGTKPHNKDGADSSENEDELIRYIEIEQFPFFLLADISTNPAGKQILNLSIGISDRKSGHPTAHFLEAFEEEAETELHL